MVHQLVLTTSTKFSWITSNSSNGWACPGFQFHEDEFEWSPALKETNGPGWPAPRPWQLVDVLKDPEAITIATLRNPLDRHVSLFLYEKLSG